MQVELGVDECEFIRNASAASPAFRFREHLTMVEHRSNTFKLCEYAVHELNFIMMASIQFTNNGQGNQFKL